MVALYIVFIAVFVFGISVVLFKKNRRKFLISGIIAAILSPVVYFAIVYYLIFTMSRERSRDFDENLWKTTSEADGEFGKYEMIGDLIESDLLINKDSLEVKKILGTPEYRDKKNDFWQYHAGISNGFGFVDHNLIVNFKHGKVSKLEHERLKD